MHNTHSGIISDGSEDEATFLASAVTEQRASRIATAKSVGVAIVGTCLVAAYFTVQSGTSHLTSRSLDNRSVPVDRTQTDLLHLLHSAEMRQAIADASVRLGGIAQHLAEAGRENGDDLRLTFNTRRLELPGKVQANLRQESALGLEASLQQFFAMHPEAHNELRRISITDEQRKATFHMLRSFTDERVFDISMHFLRRLYRSASQNSSAGHKIYEHIKLHSAELERLRDELIPIGMRKLSDDVKTQHLKLLSKKGAFHMHSRIGGWKADMELSQMRRLTPVNWFTIGAPTVSNMLGLIFLSLMALLPARGGLASNRAANYALWGLQGASTLGECFTNLGILTQGIVYISPCMIDVLFFGMDVAWVFFDGLPHNFPQRGVQCASYSLWPAINGRVCGDCLALVPTQPWGGRCSQFCGSFGHECVFAAEEVDESCIGQSRYGCDEPILFTSDMLCQCREREGTNRPACAPYSSWPSIQAGVCGDCMASVDARRFDNICENYCASFGHECASAGLQNFNEICDVRFSVSCGVQVVPLFDDDILCECRLGSGPVTAQPLCAEYAAWPQIHSFVCGDCDALVPVNEPYQGRVFRTCSEFCQSFGHECSRAARDSFPFCGAVLDEDILPCDGPIVDVRSQRCQCVLPGIVITRTTTTNTTTTITTTTITTRTTTSTRTPAPGST